MGKVNSGVVLTTLLVFLGASRPASASGPDVIVGDLYELEYWGANPISTIQAYSVGTVSCNVGDLPLLWHNWDNKRPVIGQNMFRLKNGRFEQVGQSWLKWAFVSLNQDFCGDCIDPGTGSLLGVNCSDPYSAGLNGSQSGLGPKSVVNPFTGNFPASHATPGSGTVDGRLQVQTVDIHPAFNLGALYFVEGQYVSPDDAGYGNLHNNASWRQIFRADGYEISFTDHLGRTSQTVRTEPAILAWPTLDPSVGVTYVDVPGDGRIYLAWAARPTESGAWAYEFAVQNLNSDRAVQAFVVPLPPGTTTSSIGFHDVRYHSGEPYSGTDWAGAQVGDAVRWETETFDVNPNANALRWGTLYNYRFVADLARGDLPAVELVLFKPGTPQSVFVELPPLANNDTCVDAFAVGETDYIVVDNRGATTDGPAEPGCFDGLDDADVWFAYVSSCSGQVTLSLCDSSFDTTLAVYSACPDAPGTALACNNDACGLQSEVTFEAEVGARYLVRVGGYQGARGSGLLSVSCSPGAGPPNDDCSNPSTATDGTVTFSTVGATSAGPSEAGCNFNGTNDADIWYVYAAPCTGEVTVSLCGSNFNTKLAVYADDCPAGPGTVLACNDNACGQQSELVFDATAGAVYVVRIGGANGAVGGGFLNIVCSGTGGLCPNDTLEEALDIGGLPFGHSGNTGYCNDDYEEECPFGGSTSADAVYQYTPDHFQLLDVSLCASAYDTKLYVYRDKVTPGAPYACNDDGCGDEPPDAYRSVLNRLAVRPPHTYYIVIDGWGGSEGVFDFAVTDVTPPLTGDLNCDGLIDFGDINAFVLRLSNPTEYAGLYPWCPDANGDIDMNQVVDFGDINPFVTLLAGG